MVIELLDFASFIDGRARLALEPIDPVALVNEAFDTLAPIADAEGITLELRRAPGSLPRVSCDRARIWQVLSNLLANAIRHGQAGTVKVTLAAQAGEICFSIADQGTGISELELAQLFEPGHSAAGSTGLGLAICRRIVEAHAGWIWAESAAGQGATFHFTLPIAAID
jgi:signal transduction histidine kinase